MSDEEELSDIQAGLCENGEDIDFLSACAASGDFSMLVDGVVKPEYLRDDGPRQIAERLLEIRNTNPALFPPTLESLQDSYAGFEWQEYDEMVDPLIYGLEVLESYKNHMAAKLVLELWVTKSEAPLTSGYYTAMEAAQQTLNKLKSLGEKMAMPERIGASANSVVETLLGKTVRSGNIDTPWPRFNRMIRIFYAGMYVFFARPKNGKSWILNDIAVHNSLVNGIPGIIIDPENPKEVILTRLACRYAGLSVDAVEELKYKTIHNIEYDAADLQMIVRFEEVAQMIHENSRLYVVGIEAIDDEVGRITTGYIKNLVEDLDAAYVCVDQLHEIHHSELAKRNDTDATRIMKASKAISELGIPSFVTTQENRAGLPKDYDFQWHTPSDSNVYGSDGLAQKCMFIGHVRMFKLAEPYCIPYVDPVTKQSGVVKHLQCVWPLRRRHGGAFTVEDRFFRATDVCSYEEILTNQQGTDIIEASLEYLRDQAKAQSKKDTQRAGKQAASQDAPAPRSGKPPSSVFQRAMNDRRESIDP
jgi:hypothetical protein